MRRKIKPENKDIIIPLDESSLKHSIEVPFKQVREEELIKIEKQGKVGGKRKVKIGKLKTRKITEELGMEKETEIENEYREGKAGKYILIITEKPQAALKIAYALGNARKYSENGVPYYQLERDGKKIIVACAVGHLFTVVQEEGEKGFPIFKLKWSADFKRNVWAKKYYNVLKKLCKNADSFIVATDYDIEGEVIGLNIIRFIAGQKDAKRMKFSALTKDELEKAYNNLHQTLDWGQAIAGETRHYLDWLYGINLSRALMQAIKSAGAFRIMSIGRVQGPTLHLLFDKEIAIKNFKSETYWQVFILAKGIEAKYIKDITDKAELEKFKGLKGQFAEAKTIKSEQKISPPAPFDLTTLQTEAYKFFSILPTRTLQIAQQLYLSGLISYPRTSSQKIPESINPQAIIKKLSSSWKEVKLCVRSNPVEGSKSDPAHPSIYPTGEKAELKEEEEKIYELIVRRFLSCFCEDALVENKTITLIINDLKFIARGLAIKKKAWLDVYKAKLQEKEVPDLNGKVKIDNAKIEEKQTMPPKRYSAASLVSELARRNLGTKATRASIIDTLYNRNYIEGKSIEVTPLGISLIESLKKYSPIIIDEALTRKFEKEMDSIQTAKKNLEEKEKNVLEEAKKIITEISSKLKKNEKKIGEALIKANNVIRETQRKENELIECPVCKKGKLRILFNKRSRRYFVACSAYPDCKTTFTLPHGLVKRTDKTCECSFPRLLLIKKGRRPWEFCFNPQCKLRQAKEENREENNKENTTDKSE